MLVGDCGEVGGETNVVALVNVKVGIHISLVCAPDGTRHARPWLLESKDALDVVAVDLLP